MLWDGTVKKLHSLWSSTIVVVPKPDSSLRLWNDFHKQNAIFEFDSYPLTRVDKLIKRLAKARFNAMLDLTKGYWQVALTPSAWEKTAFSAASSHCKYFPSSLWPLQSSGNISVANGHRAVASPCLHCGASGQHCNSLHHLGGQSATTSGRYCHLLTSSDCQPPKIDHVILQLQEKKVEGHGKGVGRIYPQPTSKKQVCAFLSLAMHYICLCLTSLL